MEEIIDRVDYYQVERENLQMIGLSCDFYILYLLLLTAMKQQLVIILIFASSTERAALNSYRKGLSR